MSRETREPTKAELKADLAETRARFEAEEAELVERIAGLVKAEEAAIEQVTRIQTEKAQAVGSILTVRKLLGKDPTTGAENGRAGT